MTSVLPRLALVAVAAAFAATLPACTTTRTASADNPVPDTVPSRVTSSTSGRDAARAARINSELASAYFGAGQYKTAIEVANAALRDDPNSVSALLVAAMSNAELDEYSQAATFLDRAARIAPADPDIKHNYGVLLCKQGRYNDGLAYFQQVIATPSYPRMASTLASAGGCAYRADQKDAARAYFKRALTLDYNQPAALFGMAEILYQDGNYADARGLMTRYAKAVSASPESLWLQLRIERKLGNKQDERQYAMDLRDNFPNSEQVRRLNAGWFD